MAIRINLLAESQALEDLRRRDPVKRAALVAICLIVMVLIYSLSLQVKIMADNVQRGSLESSLSTKTNDYYHILNNKKDLSDINDRLSALNRLATERFLYANLLDALMHSPVDGIQITHFSTEQTFDVITEVKSVTDMGHTIPGKPASDVEKIRVVINAKDSSPNPGNEQINKFREALAANPYFVGEQISTNNILLKNLSSPQLDNETGKPYVIFSLECMFPERSRQP